MGAREAREEEKQGQGRECGELGARDSPPPVRRWQWGAGVWGAEGPRASPPPVSWQWGAGDSPRATCCPQRGST